MPGTPHPTPQAVGQALAALERYQVHVRQLVSAGGDAELYHTVSLDIQEVRRCCRELPALSAPWVGLLIAHAELSQGLWRTQPAPERERLLEQVLENVRMLQQRCMEMAGPTH
jgi:hypothetical protein